MLRLVEAKLSPPVDLGPKLSPLTPPSPSHYDYETVAKALNGR
jgi:hypothetical protein